MIANATEAVDALRHKRTRQVLPTKNVARNTKLVYFHDQMIGLKFHDTNIATYRPWGVELDTRDADHPNGWFTMTTFERIDSFTPARTQLRDGIRRVIDPDAGSGTCLYAHGMTVNEDGTIRDRPILPAQDKLLSEALDKLPRQLARHANEVVDSWCDWKNVRECCTDEWLEDSEEGHAAKHFRDGEPVVPNWLADCAQQCLGDASIVGLPLERHLHERMLNWLAVKVLPVMLQRIAPEFTYPQISPQLIERKVNRYARHRD